MQRDRWEKGLVWTIVNNVPRATSYDYNHKHSTSKVKERFNWPVSKRILKYPSEMGEENW